MTAFGASHSRREDKRLLAGRGAFLADLAGSARHVTFVRSSFPHARLLSVDTSKARDAEGVIGIYTGADLDLADPVLGGLTLPATEMVEATEFRMVNQQLPILPVEKVTYVGQAVAAVVAMDRYTAEDAAELVEVEYEALPFETDPVEALKPDAPVLHDHLAGNEAARIRVMFGDEALDEGDAAVVEGTYRIGRHGAVPLETRGVLAQPDGDRLTVWTSTQIPHMVRRAICQATGLMTDRVRVIVPDVGGGFGTKANVYAEEIIIAALALQTGERVVWVEDRQEHLTSAAQGRDQRHQTKLTVDPEGIILKWEDDFVIDIGAGSLWVPGIIANTAIHLMGPYRIPRARIEGRAAFTAKTIVAQYRGAGRPEASFALERSLDAAARQLGLSPIEIRRRNLLTAADLPYDRPIPYRDGVPIVFDGGDYRACLEAVLELLPRSVLSEVALEHPNLRLGYGVGSYIEATGRGPYESARVRLTEAGTFVVAAGAASAGQAHETTFAQVAADALGVSMDRVRFLASDTDNIAHGVGTFGSRSAILAGSAIQIASTKLVELARDRAAALLKESAEDLQQDGEGWHNGTGRRANWQDLANAAAPGGAFCGLGQLDVVDYFYPETVTWTMGVHAAVVGVDPGTGRVVVLKYAVAHEGGNEINPMVVEGQVIGGVAQGVGGALLEEYRYDASGQPKSTTFAEYLLPSAPDVPSVDIRHLAVPTLNNPIGVRGVGESGTIAAAATIASAIDDALAGALHVASTPVSASLVRAACQQLGDLPEPVLATQGRTEVSVPGESRRA